LKKNLSGHADFSKKTSKKTQVWAFGTGLEPIWPFQISGIWGYGPTNKLWWPHMISCNQVVHNHEWCNIPMVFKEGQFWHPIKLSTTSTFQGRPEDVVEKNNIR